MCPACRTAHAAAHVLPMQPCAVQRVDTSNRRRRCCLNFEDECRAATGCGAHTAGAMTFSQGVALKCWMDRCCRGEHAAPEAHCVILDSKSEKSSAVAGGPASRCCNADMPVDANCDCPRAIVCVRFPRNFRRAVSVTQPPSSGTEYSIITIIANQPCGTSSKGRRRAQASRQ
jgi:hypothetical protein